MSTDTPSTDTAYISSAASLAPCCTVARTCRPRHLRRPRGACAAAQPHAGAGLGVLVHRAWSPTFPPTWLGEGLLGRLLRRPSGRFRRRSLPRPEHLSYVPRPTSSSPNWKSSPPKKRPSKPQKPSKRRRNRVKRSLERFALVTRPLCPADQSATARTPRYLAASKAVRPGRLPYRAAHRTLHELVCHPKCNEPESN